MRKAYFENLGKFLAVEYNNDKVHPAVDKIFAAYELCSPDDVKVVIIGQDPYPNDHAHGLSFSTNQQRRPVSLHYIFKEICDNYPEYTLENDFPTNNLTAWTRQGVFLLNAVLTVREKQPGSHKGVGWELFTRATIVKLFENLNPKVFLLWGREAEKTFFSALPRAFLNRHQLLISGHPAAAAYGKNLFSGNKHFKLANEFLVSRNLTPIRWTTKE